MEKSNVNYKSFQISQWIAIVLPLVFFCSWCLKEWTEQFRVSHDYRWIYSYVGSGLQLLMFSSIGLSLTNSIIIFIDVKGTWQKRTVWIMISSFLFFYVIIKVIMISRSVL